MAKQRKRVFSKVFISITVIIISLSATFILLYLYIPLNRSSPITPPSLQLPVVKDTGQPKIVISPPVQLKIETIGVDAVVNHVGINAAGDMDIDETPDQLAWYKLGPAPGDEGSAVIAGHYGWKNGVPSAFNDLHKLFRGDKITVQSGDGELKTFVVTRLARYSPDQDATDVFRSDDGKAHLNLITCEGSWNNSANTYTQRLVVFTDYVDLVR